jgi:hypothetical protein
MKKIYPLATLLATILIIHGAQAQTYTAVRSGKWHVNSGPNVWDPSGEPPANCSGCTITINDSVDLNTSVTLSGGSVLTVTGTGAKIRIGSSGGTDFASSFNIILINDNSNPKTSLKTSNGGVVDATAADDTYDGVFTSPNAHSPILFKQIGNGGSAYNGTTEINSRAVGTNTMSGNTTLSATGSLPITLTDFRAVLNGSAVDLTWTTKMEENSDHFDIERSSNSGATFDVVGKVTAQGYSALPVNYAFTDANPGSGTLQYRIHGYDKDGRSTYSPIQAVRTTPAATVSIYPNPARDFVNVALPADESTTGTVMIRLFGQSGQLLAERNVTNAAGTVQSFPVSSYPVGNYLLQVVTPDGAKQISKVLITR